jgi:K+-transporting ATPase A subunit
VGVVNNVITLTNIQTNALRIEYALFTPIADPIDFGKIIQDIQQSPFFVVFIGIIAIVGVYIALNREQFSQGIETYVIEHSEFKTTPKQDIDADLGTEEGAS